MTRKYYFFIVKKKYRNIYKNKNYVLYNMIDKLYKIKKDDFEYARKLYDEMFLYIAVSLLVNYLNSKKGFVCIKNRLYKSIDSYIQIMYPVIIVKTNKNFPLIFKILNIYNKNFFVCDFKTHDYFWLSDYFK